MVVKQAQICAIFYDKQILVYLCLVICAWVCVLEYLCLGICAWVCVLWYVLVYVCLSISAWVCVLGYLCLGICALVCAWIFVLGYLCLGICAWVFVLDYLCLGIYWFRDFLIVLKERLQNFYKILKTCSLGTTCIVMFVIVTNLQPHNVVLPVA